MMRSHVRVHDRDDALRSAPAPVDSLLPEHIDRQWMHPTGRARTGARYLEGTAALVVKQRLGDLTPSRILGANKQDA